MKTSDWALIQTLYECRNITRAAAQLYISQPVSYTQLDVYKRQAQSPGHGPGGLASRGNHSGPARFHGPDGQPDVYKRKQSQSLPCGSFMYAII